MTEAEEFYDIYKLKTVSVPTNETMVRNDLNDQIFRTEKEKYKAIVDKIENCNKNNQPVLVGTPIMASGTGTIASAKWCGGGGNCIKIKHNSTYTTVYGHMKNFARGMKKGKKVRQGQIIGYVGSTGMSTGPHLHYEVIVNGQKVNSQKLKLPSGKILKGNERKLFEIHRIKTDVLIADLIS